MNTLQEIISSADFWKFVIPLLGAVLAWYFNEWRKRLADQYQRKEAHYKDMLRALRGFYIGAENSQALRADFVNQLNLCWLYCPDEVIQKGYAFLDTVHIEQVCSNKRMEEALGAFVATVRQDLLSRNLVRKTKLEGKNFKHLYAR